MTAHAGGDRQAFRELFQRHAPALTRLMLDGLFAREEANDLVQQAFLQVHRARLDFDPQKRFKPWLYTIALNLKREHFRRRRRRPELLGIEPSAESATPPEQEQYDAHRSLAWALERLPAEQRETIASHWFEGRSFPEIAQASGITVSAAKVRAHRGYVRLRELLGGESRALASEDAAGNPRAEGAV